MESALTDSPPLSLSWERIGNGILSSILSSAWERSRYALLRADAFPARPVAKSATAGVRRDPPLGLGPQRATVSASTLPGRPSGSSPAFLIVIESRDGSPAGRVAADPLG
ncbi:hypothetical protein, partial [Faecalicatena contorta]|uniref:hypothetical protein n=1 Tax=Faecalicatena contorta TaxID=39482 RepID=UPI0019606384